jgi:hypothetical protein
MFQRPKIYFMIVFKIIKIFTWRQFSRNSSSSSFSHLSMRVGTICERNGARRPGETRQIVIEARMNVFNVVKSMEGSANTDKILLNLIDLLINLNKFELPAQYGGIAHRGQHRSKKLKLFLN